MFVCNEKLLSWYWKIVQIQEAKFFGEDSVGVLDQCCALLWAVAQIWPEEQHLWNFTLFCKAKLMLPGLQCLPNGSPGLRGQMLSLSLWEYLNPGSRRRAFFFFFFPALWRPHLLVLGQVWGESSKVQEKLAGMQKRVRKGQKNGHVLRSCWNYSCMHKPAWCSLFRSAKLF